MTGARIMCTLLNDLDEARRHDRPRDDVRRRRPGHGDARRARPLIDDVGPDAVAEARAFNADLARRSRGRRRSRRSRRGHQAGAAGRRESVAAARVPRRGRGPDNPDACRGSTPAGAAARTANPPASTCTSTVAAGRSAGRRAGRAPARACQCDRARRRELRVPAGARAPVPGGARRLRGRCALAARRRGAAELGAPTAFAIGGESAGAHLSALTLLRLRDRHGVTGAFRAANLVFGAFDLSGTPSARLRRRYLDPLAPRSGEWFRDCFLPGLRRRGAPRPDDLPALRRPRRPAAGPFHRRHARPAARRLALHGGPLARGRQRGGCRCLAAGDARVRRPSARHSARRRGGAVGLAQRSTACVCATCATRRSSGS